MVLDPASVRRAAEGFRIVHAAQLRNIALLFFINSVQVMQ
jgi:hypothetical protein